MIKTMPQGLNFHTEHFVPHPQTLFQHPQTGTVEFGLFPLLQSKHGQLRAGAIFVKYGEHWGPNRGYGVHHIIQEHRKLTLNQPNSVMAVLGFIAGIIQPGSQIQCEFADMRGNHRPLVVRRKTGYVVLSPSWERGEFHYSVTTAVPGGNAKGPLVGAL